MTYSVCRSRYGGIRVLRGAVVIVAVMWNSALKWGTVITVNAPRTIVCYSEEDFMQAVEDAVKADGL